MTDEALLILADGTSFKGQSIGYAGSAVGEVVFNTAMTGYQEILTDPSYACQLVTLTYPHIGNTGTNFEDIESDTVHASGLIIRDLPRLASSWRNNETLEDYLKRNKIVGIAGIDTRMLTRILRDKGAQNACLMVAETVDRVAGSNEADSIDAKKGLAAARDFAGLVGMDLAKEVTTDEPYRWNQSKWALETGFAKPPKPEFQVVAYDFGVKHNILRILAQLNCELTVVPAQTPAAEVLSMSPDGVFLSNGPGDPKACDYAINATAELVRQGIPIFGICLGHQILALALGASTSKMKFGHHGANHPVQDLSTGKVMISSQNHGFTVTEEGLPEELIITHRSLFDNTIQGLMMKNRPVFSFQGHPEASPGPHELEPLFDRFTTSMRERGKHA